MFLPLMHSLAHWVLENFEFLIAMKISFSQIKHTFYGSGSSGCASALEVVVNDMLYIYPRFT